MAKLLFLPGAGGSSDFWKPVAHGLLPDRARHFFSWPGLSAEPPDPAVHGIDDLVDRVLVEIDEPVDLVAQSMGGLVALKVALMAPDKVHRLVLAGTSGGLPVAALGGIDWRPAYLRDYPRAARWIVDAKEDLSDVLHTMTVPTLLLWGDCDRISPPAVGELLRDTLRQATLHIVTGGGHDFPKTHAEIVRPLIADYLGPDGMA